MVTQNPNVYTYFEYLKDKKQGVVNPDFANIGVHGENEMDEIIPNLWLGNYKAAYNIKKLMDNNIKNVIIICDNVETPFEDKKEFGIHYLKIPVKDRELSGDVFDNGVPIYEYMITQITRAILFIYKSLINNEGVLVHCKKGASRSAYIVKIFLMVYKNLESKSAEEFIKSRRPIAFPNKKNIARFEEPIVKYKDKFKRYFIISVR